MLNDKERKTIASIRRLALKWPKSLWLFSANGELQIMKKDKNEERAMLSNGGDW